MSPLLASEGWCREASAGRVKVYDFVKERRMGIRSLGPGSVCVVLTKAEPGKPPAFYGEFAVVEVREVSASEYEELAITIPCLTISTTLPHKNSPTLNK
jgi:hypothetical protein